MKKITPEEYCEGVESIYAEQPDYREGGDGSDNTCDCIGMGRGALERKGVENVKNMRGTNQAARKALQDLKKIKSAKDLKKGEVVLKTRDKDDEKYRLPDKYRKGESDYSEQVGETNFTHYGTVTKEWPDLEITHMTSPKPKKDTSLGNWTYSARLPWVDYEAKGQPAEEQPAAEWVRVWSENGLPVKMRSKPSSKCRLYWEVPAGAEVQLIEKGDEWSRIRYGGQTGYMMDKFLRSGEQLYTVIIRHQDEQTAKQLETLYGGEITAEG